MNNVTLHKQKLSVMIVGFIAFISMFLPRITKADAVAGGRTSSNGFHDIGFVTLLAIIPIFIFCITSDKLQGFNANNRKIILVLFGLITLLDIIFLISISTKDKTMEASINFGL
ncbi:MAG TPA: hypothetical protein VET23_00530 [Chitinophagaceae bacterium]|nr:hypothetical protein [Chitinophagaceae bacterium]